MKIKTGRGTIGIMVLFAIYSISMVTSLPGLAISPILGDLETVFQKASNLHLQMLESLPSFIIVPFILIAGRLSLRLNKKKLWLPVWSSFLFAVSFILLSIGWIYCWSWVLFWESGQEWLFLFPQDLSLIILPEPAAHANWASHRPSTTWLSY